MNRIKQLRKNKHLTLVELGQALNLPKGTLSRYENEVREPKPETWQALADYFNVSIAYLKGAYSKDEILKMLQKAYKEGSKYQASNYYQIKNSICFNVDLIMIAHGYIEPNEPQLTGMLPSREINNFKFWQANFSFMFDSVAMGWLISRPIEVSDQEILKAINEALQIELSKLATDTKEHQNEYKEWVESPSDYLRKRQEFINNHINDDGTLDFM